MTEHQLPGGDHAYEAPSFMIWVYVAAILAVCAVGVVLAMAMWRPLEPPQEPDPLALESVAPQHWERTDEQTTTDGGGLGRGLIDNAGRELGPPRWPCPANDAQAFPDRVRRYAGRGMFRSFGARKEADPCAPGGQ